MSARRHLRRHARHLIAACAALAGVASAQTGTAAGDAHSVVVTGSLSAQRVFDAPFAIGVVDAQALREAGPMVNLAAALGAALLIPVVPSMLAGAGLVGFSGGLLGMYLRTPGLRRRQSLRPTPDGIPLAKDSWMLAIGAGLILDELLSRTRKPAAVAPL